MTHILLACFIAASFINCSGKDDSLPLNTFNLWLSFEDATGKSLIEGIKTEKDGTYDGDYVIKDEYKLTSYASNHQEVSVFHGIKYYQIHDDKPIKALDFSITFPENIHENEIIHEFSCPYIFNNSNTYTIQTKWKKESFYSSCYEVLINNEKVKLETGNGLYIATIVVK